MHFISDLRAFVSLWFNRLLGLFRRRRLERDMAAEMRAHLEEQTARNRAAGMSPDDARAAAHRQFGGVAQIQERARDERGFVWLENLVRDVRFALRALRRRPGFALVAVATLALGIGANLIVFSVAQGILLRPLPFPEAEQLVWIFADHTAQGITRERISSDDFTDLQARSRSFSALATINGWSLQLDEGDKPELLDGLMVRPELFDVLGIDVVAGRRLLPSDIVENSGVMLISHELWQRRFAASTDAIGQTIRMDGDGQRTIVGVLPAGLEFPLARSPQAGNGAELSAGRKDFWVPTRPDESLDRSHAHRSETVIGRLRTGVTPGEAQAELRGIAHALAVEYPAANAGWTFTAVTLREQILGRTGPAVKILLAAVMLVLLLVCANVANLLLCRGLTRQGELAIRAALGASRMRILSQLLAEAWLLAGAGGILGLAGAAAGLKLLVILGPSSIPFLSDVGLNGTLLTTGLGLTAITGLFAGLAPAWRFSRTDAQPALKQHAVHATAAGGAVAWRNRLVIAQVAASVVLVSAALLLTRSLVRLMQVDLGFEPAHVLTAELAIGADRAGRDLRGALFAHMQELPWVEAVGAVHSVPLTSVWTIRDGFGIEGQSDPADGRRQAVLSFIGFDYFRAMGISLRRGRIFDQGESLDLDNAPVAIVSESFAHRYFPHTDPIGQVILAPGTRERRIIGVVQDTRDIRLEAAPEPQFYLPLVLGDLKLVVRTKGDPAQFLAALSGTIATVDPHIHVHQVTPMSAVVDGHVSERRFVVVLLIAFAVMALGLGGVGIYSVLQYVVAQRRREIGIRTALGAQMRDIVTMIFAHGLRLVWPGAVVGLGGAFVVLRFLESQLFELNANDLISYAGAIGAAGLVAMLATLIPARRAAKVDPIVALRSE